MYRRYYSYNDMPQVIKKNECKPEKREEKCESERCCEENKKPLGRLEIDDIILAVVILAIILDDGDDNILLLALAAIFLSGKL